MTTESENITVAIRLRPMLPNELNSRYWPRWETIENSVNELNGKKSFKFDKVYSPVISTEEIYEEIGEPVVVECMQGFNGCIFCYGQTGSGKTFTMYGNQSSQGMVPLSVQSIFIYVQETPEQEFLIRCSYLEVYNESVNDLLNKDGQNLTIQEDKRNGMIIVGLTEEICTTIDQIYSLLYIGETNKQFAATNLNMKSSRSHCIFRINVEARNRDNNGDMSFGTLYLVDLAGSESANVHNNKESIRTMEMKHINRSLLTLGNIIMRLSDSSNSAPIPYRESKLTRILRNSLEGQSKVVIVCNITASSFVFEETLSTLKFAMRAKNVKQNAKKNEVYDDKFLLKKYENEIRTLQARLRDMEALLSQNKSKFKETQVKKPRTQLDMVTNENVSIDSKIEEVIQEKISIENELSRLKAKIVVSENVSFNRIDVGIGDISSQERRRNRVSMIRDSCEIKARVRSEIFDLNRAEKIRNFANQTIAIPEAPQKIQTREEQIIEKIEKAVEESGFSQNLSFFSVIFNAEDIFEAGDEKVQNKIEEYEGYVKTLINTINRKDQEIEKLREELDLCRGNFNRLQKLLTK